MTLHELVGSVLLLLSALALVPALVLFVELVAACVPGRAAQPSEPADRAALRTASLAVLMPAHDEAAGIEAAIRAIRAQLAPQDRLLVVADNCGDATASVARAAGAEVVERHDDQRRGKGYALDFGVRWLERAAPDVVVIVDADCIVAPQALQHLAQRCLASGRPVQALYLMQCPPGASVGMRIAEFAWVVKNQARPLGSAALGGPCQLMGTGMAFPWSLIERAPLATGHLVEDMQLGLDLASAGTPPLFCPQAKVGSVFPTEDEGVRSQRTRWEHGHLSVIASAGPRLLWRALVQRNAMLAAMVLDLMVPPLASLVLVLTVLLAIDAVWWLSGGGALALVLVALAIAGLVFAVGAAWVRYGRHLVTPRELLALPIYVAAKIPVYVRLFTKRQVEWVRTKRDERGR